MTRQKVMGMDPDDILNMDETETYHSSRILEKKRAKTIHVQSSTTESKHATLAMTVMMSSKLLKPVLIYQR
jgi:hypothetical protein